MIAKLEPTILDNHYELNNHELTLALRVFKAKINELFLESGAYGGYAIDFMMDMKKKLGKKT